MAEKKDAVQPEPELIEVELIDHHTHQGRACKKGDRITIRKRQLARLREWGKVR